MNDVDSVKYFIDEVDEPNRKELVHMYLKDGAYMIADAYQAQHNCSDEERELVENGVQGIKTIYEYGSIVATFLLFAGACVNLTKIAIKVRRIFKK